MQGQTRIAITLGALALACASGALGGSSVIFTPPSGLVASVKATPEGRARIDGVVSEESGTPSVGAWVTISCACLAAPLDLATDDAGRYRAEGLAPGAYTVRIRKRSVETAKVAELPAEGRLRLNFRIRASPVVIT